MIERMFCGIPKAGVFKLHRCMGRRGEFGWTLTPSLASYPAEKPSGTSRELQQLVKMAALNLHP